MNKDPMPHNHRSGSFILRIIVDADGNLRDQVSKPGSDDEMRTTFVGKEALWHVLCSRLVLSCIEPSQLEEHPGDLYE